MTGEAGEASVKQSISLHGRSFSAVGLITLIL